MLRRWSPICAAAICLAISVSAQAQESKTSDPAGTWHWTQDYGQGPIENWLILKTENEKLSGSYVREETKHPISEGKIEAGKFSFKLTLTNERNNKPINVTCNGSVSGDELKGISKVVYNENSTDFELKAKRATRPADVVGNWKLQIDAEGRQFTPEVHIAMKDEKLTADYVTEEVGTHEIKDLSLKDNQLKFSLSISGDAGTLDLEYEGIPRGDTISGKLQYDAGSTSGTVDFSGKLTPAAESE